MTNEVMDQQVWAFIAGGWLLVGDEDIGIREASSIAAELVEHGIQCELRRTR